MLIVKYSPFMLSVITLNIIMLSVIMLNVILSSVMVPHYQPPLSPLQVDELGGVATAHTTDPRLAKIDKSLAH
jgi:hypothetical protein